MRQCSFTHLFSTRRLHLRPYFHGSVSYVHSPFPICIHLIIHLSTPVSLCPHSSRSMSTGPPSPVSIHGAIFWRPHSSSWHSDPLRSIHNSPLWPQLSPFLHSHTTLKPRVIQKPAKLSFDYTILFVRMPCILFFPGVKVYSIFKTQQWGPFPPSPDWASSFLGFHSTSGLPSFFTLAPKR